MGIIYNYLFAWPFYMCLYDTLFTFWVYFGNRYMEDFNIYVYWFFYLLAKDELFITKGYSKDNNRKPLKSNGYLQGKYYLKDNKDLHMYVWILSEDEFRKK